MTMASAASRSPCFSRIVAERRRAGLLLALDEDRDADGQAARVRAQRGDVGHDAGLVVGGAATVEAPVALGRLERRRVPVGVVAGGLHVVVGVERHRRRALGPVDVADDGRPPALDDDLDVQPLARAAARPPPRRCAPPGSGRSDEAETLGMRTSASRSARTCGMRSATRSRICWIWSGVRASSVTGRPYPRPRTVHEPDAAYAIRRRRGCRPAPSRRRSVGSTGGRQHLRRRAGALARAAGQPAQRRAPGDGHPPARRAPAPGAAARPRRRGRPGHAGAADGPARALRDRRRARRAHACRLRAGRRRAHPRSSASTSPSWPPTSPGWRA